MTKEAEIKQLMAERIALTKKLVFTSKGLTEQEHVRRGEIEQRLRELNAFHPIPPEYFFI